MSAGLLGIIDELASGMLMQPDGRAHAPNPAAVRHAIGFPRVRRFTMLVLLIYLTNFA